MADKDDRPGGMMEISPALERDLDKAAAGKIPPPPMEAFMSDAALQDAEDATRAASEPVHAEDLRAISPAEGARRSTFNGDTLSGHPSARRVIPAPYQRPSVRGGSHGKVWMSARADGVREGDIIPDLGLVAQVDEYVRREIVAGHDTATGVEIVLTGAGGRVAVFECGAQVRVFRRS